MEVGGIFIPISKLSCQYIVKKTGYFKHLDAENYRGIMNEMTEQFNPTMLSVHIQVPVENFDSTWERVNPEEIAITPITFTFESSVPFIPENLVQTAGTIRLVKQK